MTRAPREDAHTKPRAACHTRAFPTAERAGRVFVRPRRAVSLTMKQHPPNVKIVVKDGESIEQTIMRFRREVNKSGHLRVLRTKRYFEDAREKKKRKLREMQMKNKFMRNKRKMNLQKYDTGM